MVTTIEDTHWILFCNRVLPFTSMVPPIALLHLRVNPKPDALTLYTLAG